MWNNNHLSSALLVMTIGLYMDKAAQVTAPAWIRQPGVIQILDDTKLVLNWTHPIQPPLDITWDYKGTDSQPVLNLIMSFTTGAGVYIPIQDQWSGRVGYDQSVNGSAIMTLDNVMSADEKYFGVNVVNLDKQTLRLTDTASIQIISASTINMTVSIGGEFFELSMIENGTNISLPDFMMITAPLPTEIIVQVNSTAPKPQNINFDNYVDGIIQDTMYCERSYCCERLVGFNLGTPQTGELVISVIFIVQNLPPIVISRDIRLNASSTMVPLDPLTSDNATTSTTDPNDIVGNLKIGLGVGFGIIILIIAVLGTALCLRWRRGQNTRSQMQDVHGEKNVEEHEIRDVHGERSVEEHEMLMFPAREEGTDMQDVHGEENVEEHEMRNVHGERSVEEHEMLMFPAREEGTDMPMFPEGEEGEEMLMFPAREEGRAVVNAMKNYVLDNVTYNKIMDIMQREMEKGLDPATNPEAKDKMFPTYVPGVPDGSETGDFLALDLSGPKLRVMFITLEGNRPEIKVFPIPHETMTGPGVELFDHIANCIKDFMQSQRLNGKRLPLSFSFGFPLKQESLNSGRLIRWIKGFTCDGVQGQDVVKMLNEAITRKRLDVECVAIVNDTVGCLMSCAFLDHNTEVGVILGTGTNACYLEMRERVGTWDGDNNDPVIINTEWEAFGDNGCIDFIRTEADRDVDSNSVNPGEQLFEKMIAEMYMGEIARQEIVHCAQQGLLFGGNVTDALVSRDRFSTKFVFEIEADKEEGYLKTRQVLDELDLATVTKEDCEKVRYICAAVCRRAAFLASAGIATLINRINKPNITVAVDGDLYRYHPHFQSMMRSKIQELIHPGLQFKLMLSEDGSAKGAALVAAVAQRISSSGKT